MQPPRQRRPRLTLAAARLLMALAMDAGALLVTVLLLRLITVSSSSVQQSSFSRIVRNVSNPITWPATRVPGIGGQSSEAATVADLVTLVAVILLTALAVGVIAGWEAEGRQ